MRSVKAKAIRKYMKDYMGLDWRKNKLTYRRMKKAA